MTLEEGSLIFLAAPGSGVPPATHSELVRDGVQGAGKRFLICLSDVTYKALEEVFYHPLTLEKKEKRE